MAAVILLLTNTGTTHWHWQAGSSPGRHWHCQPEWKPHWQARAESECLGSASASLSALRLLIMPQAHALRLLIMPQAQAAIAGIVVVAIIPAGRPAYSDSELLLSIQTLRLWSTGSIYPANTVPSRLRLLLGCRRRRG
jgi:hypothetical protein